MVTDRLAWGNGAEIMKSGLCRIAIGMVIFENYALSIMLTSHCAIRHAVQQSNGQLPPSHTDSLCVMLSPCMSC